MAYPRVAEREILPIYYSDAVPECPKDLLDRSLLLLLHLSISLRERCRFVMGFGSPTGIWSMFDSFLFPLPVTGWWWLTWSLLALPTPSQLPLVPCSLVFLAPSRCIFSFCPISSQHHELGGSYALWVAMKFPCKKTQISTILLYLEL